MVVWVWEWYLLFIIICHYYYYFAELFFFPATNFTWNMLRQYEMIGNKLHKKGNQNMYINKFAATFPYYFFEIFLFSSRRTLRSEWNKKCFGSILVAHVPQIKTQNTSTSTSTHKLRPRPNNLDHNKQIYNKQKNSDKKIEFWKLWWNV